MQQPRLSFPSLPGIVLISTKTQPVAALVFRWELGSAALLSIVRLLCTPSVRRVLVRQTEWLLGNKLLHQGGLQTKGWDQCARRTTAMFDVSNRFNLPVIIPAALRSNQSLQISLSLSPKMQLLWLGTFAVPSLVVSKWETAAQICVKADIRCKGGLIQQIRCSRKRLLQGYAQTATHEDRSVGGGVFDWIEVKAKILISELSRDTVEKRLATSPSLWQRG